MFVFIPPFFSLFSPVVGQTTSTSCSSWFSVRLGSSSTMPICRKKKRSQTRTTPSERRKNLRRRSSIMPNDLGRIRSGELPPIVRRYCMYSERRVSGISLQPRSTELCNLVFRFCFGLSSRFWFLGPEIDARSQKWRRTNPLRPPAGRSPPTFHFPRTDSLMDLSLPSLFLFFAQIAPCSIAVDRPCWAAGFRGEVGERREHPGERRTTLAIVINCPPEREREEKEESWRDREPQPKLCGWAAATGFAR